MERTRLEDRIRASLEARANDVEPTPALWERVDRKTRRGGAWTAGLWAVAGVAVVAIGAAFALPALLPDGGVAIDDQPATQPPATDDPQPTPTAPTDQPAVPGTSVRIVTTDGQRILQVDAATGEEVATLFDYGQFAEGNTVGGMALRPTGDGFTVAATVMVEAEWDLDVLVFDAAGEFEDRHRIKMIAPPDVAATPNVTWSDDGRYLTWVETSPDSTESSLHVLDWSAWLQDPKQPGEPSSADFSVASLNSFVEPGVGRVEVFDGRLDEGSSATIFVSSLEGRVHTVLVETAPCPSNEGCAPVPVRQADSGPQEFALEGGAPVDVDFLDVTSVVLAARGGGADAEGAVIELIHTPMDGNQGRLPLPDGFLQGTAVPGDAWLVADDRTVLVGTAGRAWALHISGDLAEDLEVTSTVELPGGTVAAGLVGGAIPSTPSTAEADPTEQPTAAPPNDGAPSHVVTADQATQMLALVQRGAAEPVVQWGRPGGVAEEAQLASAVVHPSSSPAEVGILSRWVAGEGDTLAWTQIRDGEVTTNEGLPADLQPVNRGGAAETADVRPVFDPAGEWLGWVQRPDPTGGFQLRVLAWGDTGPTGETLDVPIESDVPPLALLDWVWEDAGDSPQVAAMTLSRADGVDGVLDLTIPADAEGRLATAPVTTTDVTSPGPVVAAGSYTYEDGAERYSVWFDEDRGQLRYGYLTMPEAATDTGILEPDAGALLAFGPDQLLVRDPDGNVRRVLFSDPAVLPPIETPEDTVAFLPWPTAP